MYQPHRIDTSFFNELFLKFELAWTTHNPFEIIFYSINWKGYILRISLRGRLQRTGLSHFHRTKTNWSGSQCAERHQKWIASKSCTFYDWQCSNNDCKVAQANGTWIVCSFQRILTFVFNLFSTNKYFKYWKKEKWNQLCKNLSQVSINK